MIQYINPELPLLMAVTVCSSSIFSDSSERLFFTMQRILYSYIAIYLAGLFGIWKAVPVGFVTGANPAMIWLMTTLGATSAVIILYFFGNRIREYLSRKLKINKKQTRAGRLLDKYGAAGLGFFGCLLMGPNLTILTGLVIVNSPKKLLFWTVAGIVIWSLVLTLLGVFSIDLFMEITSFPT